MFKQTALYTKIKFTHIALTAITISYIVVPIIELFTKLHGGEKGN